MKLLLQASSIKPSLMANAMDSIASSAPSPLSIIAAVNHILIVSVTNIVTAVVAIATDGIATFDLASAGYGARTLTHTIAIVGDCRRRRMVEKIAGQDFCRMVSRYQKPIVE